MITDKDAQKTRDNGAGCIGFIVTKERMKEKRRGKLWKAYRCFALSFTMDNYSIMVTI